jgi:hypothetical protein
MTGGAAGQGQEGCGAQHHGGDFSGGQVPSAHSPTDPERSQSRATDTPDPPVMRAQEDGRQDVQAGREWLATHGHGASDQLAQATHDEEQQAERQEPPQGCPERCSMLCVHARSDGR